MAYLLLLDLGTERIQSDLQRVLVGVGLADARLESLSPVRLHGKECETRHRFDIVATYVVLNVATEFVFKVTHLDFELVVFLALCSEVVDLCPQLVDERVFLVDEELG